MKLIVALLALVVLGVAGCAPTREGGRAKIEGLAKKVTPGMTEAKIREMFGEPDEIVKGEPGRAAELNNQDPEKSIVWRFKKLDEFYELWVRFYDGKAAWAMAYDKDSKLSEG